MNLSNINTWLTFGSNLAVLVGIVLILLELNQNADLMRAQMSQERANLVVQQYEARIHSDYWPQIAAKRAEYGTGREFVSSLDPIEYQRLRNSYLAEINNVRNQYFLYSEGYLSEDVWRAQSVGQASRMIALAYAFGVPEPFEGNPGFREELQRIAEEYELPFPDENGYWDD